MTVTTGRWPKAFGRKFFLEKHEFAGIFILLIRPLRTAPHANLRASLKPLVSGRCARGRVQNTTLFDTLPRATQNRHSGTTQPADVLNQSEHQLELCNFSLVHDPLIAKRKMAGTR